MKSWIILQKSFSKSCFAFFLKSVFISIYGFSQIFWLNLITLWTFFETNLWFNACSKFLMCIAYSVLSCKLATSFSTFQSSFFQVKTVIHHDVHLMFQNIDYQIQKKSFTTFFFIVFYEIFIKLKSIFDPLKIIYWKLLRHCPTI